MNKKYTIDVHSFENGIHTVQQVEQEAVEAKFLYVSPEAQGCFKNKNLLNPKFLENTWTIGEDE